MMGPTIVLWQFIESIIRVLGQRRENVLLISKVSCIQCWDSDLLDMSREFMQQGTGEAFGREFILRNDGDIREQASSTNKTLDLKKKMYQFAKAVTTKYTGWVANATEIYFLIDLDAGNLRLGCQQASFLLRSFSLAYNDHLLFYVFIWSTLCTCTCPNFLFLERHP